MPQIKDIAITKTIAGNADFLVMQSPSGETYKITKSDLLGGSSSSTTKILTYSSNGDANGVFYWLGTQKGLAAWGNPISAGQVAVTMSSIFNNDSTTHGNGSLLANRLPGTGVATTNTASQNIKFGLNGKKLICTNYSIRGRSSTTNEIRNWKFQASNDSSTWVDLDSVVNTSLGSSTWYSKSISGQTIAYEFFRILSTGVDSGGANILAFDELELYGTLQG
ncbi:MAG TPA: hypothetical protein VE944_32905 [Nostoc sp.]|uniref:hypothetical protein n=1 Tax=Nostoc sp. TaxID=1180 RepID=UPI002D5A133A|nr:hypothetical protein [Nostoc sp.]HYX19069.1 hypothetical protein [Nostoc sp.]